MNDHKLIVNFDVQPRTVEAGQPVTVTWETSDAAEVKIEPMFGAVEHSGTRDAPLEKNTDVTVIVVGEDDSREWETISVTVSGAG